MAREYTNLLDGSGVESHNDLFGAWRSVWFNGYGLTYPHGGTLIALRYADIKDTEALDRVSNRLWDWEH